MTNDLTGSVPGATPLDADDVAGLKAQWVATREELNTVEQENILDALVWARGQRWTVARVADPVALKDLHRRMFANVWTWAGKWRTRQTNIGIAAPLISTTMYQLEGDLLAQTADPGHLAWPTPELLARFHHRLVCIHPFANGNGRHARLATDLLAEALGWPIPQWGSEGLGDASADRERYLAALRQADTSASVDLLTAFMWTTSR